MSGQYLVLKMQRAEQHTDQRTDSDQPKKRTVGRPFPKGTSGNPGGSRDWRKQHEAKRQAVELELARDVERQRPLSSIDRLLITEAAGLHVRAQALRSRGKPADDVTRLLMRCLAKLGIKPGAGAKPGRTLAELVAQKAAAAAAEAR